jgi:nucleoside 2-deoxyribosyltransferase
MKAYLASGFRQRKQLRILAEQLNKLKIQVCSSWIWLESRPERNEDNWHYFAEKIAGTNLIDLTQADILILDTNGIADSNHGGCHFETGFMFARHKKIYIVGERNNTFHWVIPNIHENYESLIEQLKHDQR